MGFKPYQLDACQTNNFNFILYGVFEFNNSQIFLRLRYPQKITTKIRLDMNQTKSLMAILLYGYAYPPALQAGALQAKNR